MYFSAASRNHTDRHCVGAAVSSTILGPYEPVNYALSCNFDQGGVIDPTFLNDPLSNLSFVIYKNDGNAIGSGGACSNSAFPNTPTTFEFNVVSNDDYITRLDNGTWSPVGNTSWFLSNSEDDGPNIESPQIWYHEYNHVSPGSTENVTTRSYHMMYNSGCYADKSYRIKHIICWVSQNTSFHYLPFFKVSLCSCSLG